MSTILVSGATGFIGSCLCRRLVADGHEVHGISRHVHPSRQGMQWWRGDLSDARAVSQIMKGTRPQIVFHLASRVTGARDVGEVASTFQANLASSVNILTSALETGCQRVVLAGSSEEPVQNDGAAPCSPYAAAKWSATSYARMFGALFHVPVVVPRIFMTYGPGQRDVQKVVPYTILSMLRGEQPKLSSGRRQVDWVYVDDVVEGLVRAAFCGDAKEITFDLGSGTLVSVRTIVEYIAEIIGNGIKPEFGAIPDRPLEPERIADTRFLEETFRWKPSTPWREGLRKTVEWYKRARDLTLWVASLLWAVSGLWPDLLDYQEAVTSLTA